MLIESENQEEIKPPHCLPALCPKPEEAEEKPSHQIDHMALNLLTLTHQSDMGNTVRDCDVVFSVWKPAECAHIWRFLWIDITVKEQNRDKEKEDVPESCLTKLAQP